MEHHLYHPSAPNGDTARASRVIPGSYSSSDLQASSGRLPWNTQAPNSWNTQTCKSGHHFPIDSEGGRQLRLLALLALTLLTVTLLSRSSAELPLQPQISIVPTQTIANGVAPWQNGAYRVEPLAGYDVTARVLSARGYSENRESEVSPIDLALGWGPMADRALLQSLNVSQRDRWYFVRWRNAPVRAEEVIANSANTHLLPADAEVAEQLEAVEPGDIVRLKGYLVKVSAEDGWTWTSSTSRYDTGDGSCEILWVESVEVHSDAPITYASMN